MPVPTPPLIPQPFAESGERADIPDTTVATGRAAYDVGFPPITMTPKIAGGLPPDGRDMNGILYALSAHCAFVQAGQPFMYSSAVSTAIGGYAVGTLLGSTDGTTVWLNLVNGNTTNPDASGTGWIPFASYGSSSISGLTGGVRVLTNVEARYNTIVLAGTLIANQAIELPAELREWRIVNLTTGAFVTTVRNTGGTGVTVPQGGYSASVGVYGNGTDIFLQVPPVSLPIDVAATPNTILKRDNVADAYARYFNSAAVAENTAVSGLYFNNGADGALRLITLGNFLSQAFASAVLTGVPTAPTAPTATNTDQIASTAFVHAVASAALPYKVAYGRVNSAGVLQANSSGITSVTRTGTGTYTVNVTAAGFQAGTIPTAITTNRILAFDTTTISANMTSNTSCSVTAFVENLGGQDRDFQIFIIGI